LERNFGQRFAEPSETTALTRLETLRDEPKNAKKSGSGDDFMAKNEALEAF
jgi:hypothetical protein